MDHINLLSLPDEILINVGYYLNNIDAIMFAYTCRRIHTILHGQLKHQIINYDYAKQLVKSPLIFAHLKVIIDDKTLLMIDEDTGIKHLEVHPVNQYILNIVVSMRLKNYQLFTNIHVLNIRELLITDNILDRLNSLTNLVHLYAGYVESVGYLQHIELLDVYGSFKSNRRATVYKCLKLTCIKSRSNIECRGLDNCTITSSNTYTTSNIIHLHNCKTIRVKKFNDVKAYNVEYLDIDTVAVCNFKHFDFDTNSLDAPLYSSIIYLNGSNIQHLTIRLVCYNKPKSTIFISYDIMKSLQTLTIYADGAIFDLEANTYTTDGLPSQRVACLLRSSPKLYNRDTITITYTDISLEINTYIESETPID